VPKLVDTPLISFTVSTVRGREVLIRYLFGAKGKEVNNKNFKVRSLHRDKKFREFFNQIPSSECAVFVWIP
jgi:hypothetical protein